MSCPKDVLSWLSCPKDKLDKISSSSLIVFCLKNKEFLIFYEIKIQNFDFWSLNLVYRMTTKFMQNTKILTAVHNCSLYSTYSTQLFVVQYVQCTQLFVVQYVQYTTVRCTLRTVHSCSLYSTYSTQLFVVQYVQYVQNTAGNLKSIVVWNSRVYLLWYY